MNRAPSEVERAKMKKKTGGRPLTDAQIRQIVTVHRSLRTYRGTAKQLGHSVTTVKKYIALSLFGPASEPVQESPVRTVPMTAVRKMLATEMYFLAEAVRDESDSIDDALMRAYLLGRSSTIVAPVDVEGT